MLSTLEARYGTRLKIENAHERGVAIDRDVGTSSGRWGCRSHRDAARGIEDQSPELLHVCGHDRCLPFGETRSASVAVPGGAVAAAKP